MSNVRPQGTRHMPYYRVMLHASGIRVPVAGSVRPIIGFYTTRLVRAASEAQAAHKATENVSAQWATPEYSQTNLGGPPELIVESVSRATFLDSLRFRGTGHSFYVS